MLTINLFGEEVPVVEEPVSLKRKPTVPKGYAAPPGSGPNGETCKSCKHYAIRRWSKDYRKCALMRAHWTCGPGSDIKAGSPACSRWERPE